MLVCVVAKFAFWKFSNVHFEILSPRTITTRQKDDKVLIYGARTKQKNQHSRSGRYSDKTNRNGKKYSRLTCMESIKILTIGQRVELNKNK